MTLTVAKPQTEQAAALAYLCLMPLCSVRAGVAISEEDERFARSVQELCRVAQSLWMNRLPQDLGAILVRRLTEDALTTRNARNENIAEAIHRFAASFGITTNQTEH